MLRKLYILSLALTLTPTAALAETAAGFYVAGGLAKQQQHSRTHSNEIFDGPPVTIDASNHQQSSGGTLLVGYQFLAGTNSMAMLEAGADFGTGVTFSGHGESGPNSLDTRWKMARNWFLAFKPGLRLSDGVVGYLSFAYHSADIDFSRTIVGSQNNTRIGTRTVGGAGVGIGFQGRISERVFVRGEVENIFFGRSTFDFTPASDTSGTIVSVHSLRPEAFVGRVIVGYRF